MAYQPQTQEVLGLRIGAALIDLLILFVFFIVFGIATGGGEAENGNASVRTGGAETLIYVFLTLAYYFILESYTGQTVGKRALGIKVVAMDGSSPTAPKIALRTLLRLVDGILIYLVGLIVLLTAGRRRQRLGDMAAGTTVVRA